MIFELILMFFADAMQPRASLIHSCALQATTTSSFCAPVNVYLGFVLRLRSSQLPLLSIRNLDRRALRRHVAAAHHTACPLQSQPNANRKLST
jgi:hypothetical protein